MILNKNQICTHEKVCTDASVQGFCLVQMTKEKKFVHLDVYRKKVCTLDCVQKKSLHTWICTEKKFAHLDLYRKKVCTLEICAQQIPDTSTAVPSHEF